MDAMLQAVLDADQREREKTQQLEETRELIFDELRAKKEKLFSQAREDARRDIEAIAEKLNKQTEERLEALCARGGEALRILGAYGESRCEKWAEALCGQLIMNN